MPTRMPSRRGSSEMQTRAKDLRRNFTGPERALWALVRDRQVARLKFRRQQVIGPYIVDFYCAQAQLVVEVDGESHVGKAERDAARDAYLQSHGLRVVRITNDDVLREPEAVALVILRAAGSDS